MTDPGDHELTRLIAATRDGDPRAWEQLSTAVYEELRTIARHSRFVGRAGETMQATVLANEAFMQLERRFPVPPRDQPETRATFFRAVAQSMRRILRDHWRAKQTRKRGGDVLTVVIGEHDLAGGGDALPPVDFLALDDALDRLEAYNKRWWDVVMHRYLAGRTIDETAELMGVGVRTVSNDWEFARAWLRRELGGDRP